MGDGCCVRFVGRRVILGIDALLFRWRYNLGLQLLVVWGGGLVPSLRLSVPLVAMVRGSAPVRSSSGPRCSSVLAWCFGSRFAWLAVWGAVRMRRLLLVVGIFEGVRLRLGIPGLLVSMGVCVSRGGVFIGLCSTSVALARSLSALVSDALSRSDRFVFFE